MNLRFTASVGEFEPLPQGVVENSSLYREFMAKRDEILKHKWYESEKVGHDVGFDHALFDWALKYGSAWARSRNEIAKHTTGKSDDQNGKDV
jgi:hypothetical protein